MKKLNKNLAILLSGQLISQIGDKFYLLALSYWILEKTGSASLMGMVLFFTIFPETVLGLFAGAYVDRFDRKWIIVGTDFLRGIIILVVGILYYFNQLGLIEIIVAQVLLSINAAFFNPAIPAVIPQIVEEKELAKANSQKQLVRGIALVVGPVLGGLAVVQIGYLFIFLFNGISFLFSAAFEIFLKLPKTIHPGEQEQTSIGEDIKEGYQLIKNNGELIGLILCIAVIHFFVGAIQTITPVFAVGLQGNGAQNLGFLQTAFGFGMVGISFLFGVVNFINGREKTVLFGAIFLVGLVNVVMGSFLHMGLNHVIYHLVPFFAFGGAIIVAVTCFRTIVQKQIPNQMAGRVFGVAFSVGDASIPLAMLIFGFLLDRFDVGNLLLISGGCLMFFCLFFIMQPWLQRFPDFGRSSS